MNDHDGHNLTLVRDILEGLGRGDLAALLQRCHDDVVLRYPGPPSIPYAGRHEGRERFERFFHAIDAAVDVERYEVSVMLAGGDSVAVVGECRFRAKATGRSFDDRFVLIWTIRDGKVAALDEYHDTAAIAAAFEARA